MHHNVTDDTCLCTALRKASRAVTRLYDDRMSDAGMTTAQFAILRALERGGDQVLSHLADGLVMDRTSLYRAIDPLARRGWITITASHAGRSKRATLTGDGRAALSGAVPLWRAAQMEIMGGSDWTMLKTRLAGLTAEAGAAR